MIYLSRTVLIEALKNLEASSSKEYSNIVGNAMNGHGQFALKVLMNQDILSLTEDQIYSELWEMLKSGAINEEQHDQFIRDLRNNSKAVGMIGRYLRKSRRIQIKN